MPARSKAGSGAPGDGGLGGFSTRPLTPETWADLEELFGLPGGSIVQGARVFEAYPVDKADRSHDDFMFFGSRSLYERAGFREVVRRSPTRLVMRRELGSAELASLERR